MPRERKGGELETFVFPRSVVALIVLGWSSSLGVPSSPFLLPSLSLPPFLSILDTLVSRVCKRVLFSLLGASSKIKKKYSGESEAEDERRAPGFSTALVVYGNRLLFPATSGA